ncbi:MAG: toxin-antitoxin system HicB family antitoxin [Lachnospiraceae bacterium]|nr:toxin-antitoxin system HicB family antitoxin [Lachnospiraceae bacterium]
MTDPISGALNLRTAPKLHKKKHMNAAVSRPCSEDALRWIR